MSYQTGNCEAPAAPAAPRRKSQRRIKHRFIIEKRVHPEHVCVDQLCRLMHQRKRGNGWWRAGVARDALEAERWIEHDMRHFGGNVRRIRPSDAYEYRVVDTHRAMGNNAAAAHSGFRQ